MMQMSAKRSSHPPGSVRIVGGRWRGRRIPVSDFGGIRPTPDRVRETLFNWLAPVLDGARCLDLFAGTGVLGLEALSRGAAESRFVEKNPAAGNALQAELEKLDCDGATLVAGNALAFLKQDPSPFDIVFVDPPFDSLDLGNLCTLLDEGWLSRGAHVYLELSKRSEMPPLPDRWDLTHEKVAGEVRFGLARRA
jgi:16S rRNA (guanine966-N2)-methyltransferase